MNSRPKTTQQFFQLRDCSQMMLLPKINVYLAQQKKPSLNYHRGYCHGLTLLWLYKMVEGKAQWFYDVVDRIVSSTTSDFRKFDADIEKFIAYIDWGQNSETYTQSSKSGVIRCSDVDKILKIPQVDVRYQWFTYPDFYKFLHNRLYQNEMTVLSCLDSRIWHTIGIFVSGPVYFLYDSNSLSCRPKMFTSPELLIHEIRHCFYVSFHQPLPSHYMPLEAHVLKNPERKI